jgi:hypothetical protein
VPLRCQQELLTQGFLGVSTGKNPEDSNLASVEAMQWALLYLSIGHDIENISHSAAKCAGAPTCIPSAVTHKLNVSGHMLMRTFVLWFVDLVPSLSAPFSYILYIE